MSIPSIRRLSVKAVCLSAAVVTTVAVTAGVAWAAYTDNMYPTQYEQSGCFSESGPDGQVSCQTDNATLTYYMDGAGTNMLETEDRNVVISVMNTVYGPTDFSVSLDTSPEFSGSAETDIVYEESAVGMSESADGVTFCNNAASTLKCDQQYIRIRGGGHYVKGLTCHETGHAVGLLHGNKSSPMRSNTDEQLGCMETPTSDEEGLQANNIENINATY
ncbi:hypothetical protein [Glycomyces artemisiae]|uniref:Matrixin n=1 Tax=Glycomyces artemisiae TaxID=1076443 RepID=A0A2T0UDR4_9ACTN|nr:hypothetical protein [Glycomyces artemisiae]PRY55998.1 hypothetical protein B0I28_111104 [Glycomyces artemisiae]